ncbi:prepilin peptidase [Photobacterium leiognathi]|uniref:prepilin peptidase n=1 Tax=Photobacterium leiognathi TaxID=553611 RepID=UPI002980EB5C|nr:prepilin peptidase [Photobacterium leiognathi]
MIELIIVAILCLCMGSFLNVVIIRTPLIQKKLEINYIEETYNVKVKESDKVDKISISFPNSKCNRCDRKLAKWMNIPLISYIILLGRCYFCKKTISKQYPTVELLTSATGTITYYTYGPTITFLSVFLLAMLFIVIAYIDINNYVIYADHESILLGSLITVTALINSDKFIYIGITYLSLALTIYIIEKIIIFIKKKETTIIGSGDFWLLAFGIGYTFNDIELGIKYLQIISISAVALYFILQRKDGKIPLIPSLSLGFMYVLTTQ